MSTITAVIKTTDRLKQINPHERSSTPVVDSVSVPGKGPATPPHPKISELANAAAIKILFRKQYFRTKPNVGTSHNGISISPRIQLSPDLPTIPDPQSLPVGTEIWITAQLYTIGFYDGMKQSYCTNYGLNVTDIVLYNSDLLTSQAT